MGGAIAVRIVMPSCPEKQVAFILTIIVPPKNASANEF